MSHTSYKAASMALFLNIILTVLKYGAYILSGSLAILAETLHSFSDIVTSVGVLISIRLRKKDKPAKESRLKDPECIISLLIGLLLFFIALNIFIQVVKYGSVKIDYPVEAGILFIIFSFGNYVVHRFELTIGLEESSPGLMSDGMHAKADMTSSLLTGFSLILYAAGLNIDRFVALLIGIFIFFYAIETLVSTTLYIFKKDTKQFFQYKTREIIAYLSDKNTYLNLLGTIDKIFHIDIESSRYYRWFIYFVKYVIPAMIIISYLSTSVYVVDISSEAIIERLGKPLSFEKPVGPGLHFKLPFPFDKVMKIQTKRISIVDVGNIPDKDAYALLWTVKHGTDEPFISGDNNYFYPYVTIHYTIKNVYDYYYLHRNNAKLIDMIAHNVFTEIFSEKSFYDIVTGFRNELSSYASACLQEKLDKIKSGLNVVSVNIKDIHPPISIGDSFEKVIASMQEKETFINEAYAYKNSSLPQSQSTAYRDIKKAESYVIDKTNRSTGDTRRFSEQIQGYRMNRPVIQKVIFLSSIKDYVRDNRKIIVDPDAGVPQIWLDFLKVNKDKINP
ncbi:MAG: cation diffusion facilitator family transporter [Candidatus Hydrogenedentota bacterium]